MTGEAFAEVTTGFKVLSDPGRHTLRLLVRNTSAEGHRCHPPIAGEHDEGQAAETLGAGLFPVVYFNIFPAANNAQARRTRGEISHSIDLAALI